ncbi:MAG: hypothetical protein IKM62_01690 [Kiritimatiellae bacterium]|nr:hypothetical protein [Kiritimatiellia bacterium]
MAVLFFWRNGLSVGETSLPGEGQRRLSARYGRQKRLNRLRDECIPGGALPCVAERRDDFRRSVAATWAKEGVQCGRSPGGRSPMLKRGLGAELETLRRAGAPKWREVCCSGVRERSLPHIGFCTMADNAQRAYKFSSVELSSPIWRMMG